MRTLLNKATFAVQVGKVMEKAMKAQRENLKGVAQMKARSIFRVIKETENHCREIWTAV